MEASPIAYQFFSLVDIVGMIGTILTSIIYFPQIYELYKTKEVAGLTYSYQVISILDAFAWIFYGYLLGSYELMVSYSIITICALIVCGYKYIYDNKEKQVIPLTKEDEKHIVKLIKQHTTKDLIIPIQETIVEDFE